MAYYFHFSTEKLIPPNNTITNQALSTAPIASNSKPEEKLGQKPTSSEDNFPGLEAATGQTLVQSVKETILKAAQQTNTFNNNNNVISNNPTMSQITLTSSPNGTGKVFITFPIFYSSSTVIVPYKDTLSYPHTIDYNGETRIYNITITQVPLSIKGFIGRVGYTKNSCCKVFKVTFNAINNITYSTSFSLPGATKNCAKIKICIYT